MNVCKRCSNSYSSEDKFCGFCGFNLAALATSEMVTRVIKSSNIHFDLGLKYFTEGKYSEAIESLDKALSINPGDDLIQEMLERARQESKKTDEKNTTS